MFGQSLSKVPNILTQMKEYRKRFFYVTMVPSLQLQAAALRAVRRRQGITEATNSKTDLICKY